MKTIKILAGTLLLIIIIALAAGPLMSLVESPHYHLLHKEKNIELREYPPLLVAEFETNGNRSTAIDEGFRVLASYIFGHNQAKEDIAMTKPVMELHPQQIGMTAPILQEGNNGEWLIRFVMPTRFNENTLPQPVDKRIQIKQLPLERVIAIRFSGSNSQENIDTHLKMLSDYISKNNIKTIGQPIFAFYNPPWTLPFLRRNEIWFALEPSKP